MYYTEEQIDQYSKPLSDSEKQSCESTIRVFETILQKYGFSVTRKNFDIIDSEDLNHRFHVKKDNLEFTIFLQGSYGNGTCVRQDSDVDIAMICESTFRVKYPCDKSDSDYKFRSSDFDIIAFKDEFCQFIRNVNSSYKVENHDKCIFFEGNGSSRKDMDIVPSLRYRDYSNDYYSNPNNYHSGVLIKTNKGEEIINYPEQSRINSIKKNKATSYYYKKIVRILKNIKNDMIDNGVMGADKVSSYGLECMIYNVPNDLFNSYYGYYSLKEITYSVVKYLCEKTYFYPFFKETNGILNIFDNLNNDKQAYELIFLKIKTYLEG